jgi:hypothetical protein
MVALEPQGKVVLKVNSDKHVSDCLRRREAHGRAPSVAYNLPDSYICALQVCSAVAVVALSSSNPSELMVALNLLKNLLECCRRKPEGTPALPDLLHGLLKCAANPSLEVRSSLNGFGFQWTNNAPSYRDSLGKE